MDLSRRSGSRWDHIDPDVTTFAHMVHRELVRKRVSMRQLARECDLHYSTISRILNGETDPNLSTVIKLLKHLDVVWQGGNWWTKT